MVIGAATLSEEGSVQRLANAYRRAALKVKGLPIYNPTIAVEAVGFREYEGRQVGVIVTPWFMNLTALPSESDLKVWLAGRSTMLGFPSGAYEFTVTDLQDVGLIATCSLFSTMLDFTDHEAAQLAAKTVAINVDMACDNSGPICQDTGTPLFYVSYPEGWSGRDESRG